MFFLAGTILDHLKPKNQNVSDNSLEESKNSIIPVIVEKSKDNKSSCTYCNKHFVGMTKHQLNCKKKP